MKCRASVPYVTYWEHAADQPTLLFIAKRTNTGRFAKPGVNGHKSTRFLEDMLIGMALANNPLLENIKGTAMIKELVC